MKPANKCVGVADYFSAKLKNLVSYHAVGKGGSCIFFMLCNVAKLFSFGVSLDFHHKVCKREGMYRRLEGNDCGNKGKETSVLG